MITLKNRFYLLFPALLSLQTKCNTLNSLNLGISSIYGTQCNLQNCPEFLALLSSNPEWAKIVSSLAHRTSKARVPQNTSDLVPGTFQAIPLISSVLQSSMYLWL